MSLSNHLPSINLKELSPRLVPGEDLSSQDEVPGAPNSAGKVLAFYAGSPGLEPQPCINRYSGTCSQGAGGLEVQVYSPPKCKIETSLGNTRPISGKESSDTLGSLGCKGFLPE